MPGSTKLWRVVSVIWPFSLARSAKCAQVPGVVERDDELNDELNDDLDELLAEAETDLIPETSKEAYVKHFERYTGFLAKHNLRRYVDVHLCGA